MGLNTETLAPPEQHLIRNMEVILLSTLRTASILLDKETGLSMKYFGDRSPRWIFYLQVMLRRMATMLSIHEFELHGSHINSVNSSSYANAERPFSGWRNNALGKKNVSFITCSQYTDFHIKLGATWHTAPNYYLPDFYCYPTKPAYPMARIKEGPVSKFHIVIHELTHLIYNTDDIVYGYGQCLELVRQSPEDSKRNADNWAFFIEHVWGLPYLND
ncbi:MAG: hypothetical protein KAH18_01260 [Psychromonas sp.]|nr:hypothetical protein [Psychromonas sp.]